MPELPSGTVTFLFTDIERSTESAATLGDERWAEELETHHALLRPAFARHGGVEVGTEGDAFFVAFATATDAVDGQRALESHAWASEARLRVRMGMHTGEALVRGNDYVGHAVHKAKRVSDAGHGGQVILSQTTADLVRDRFSLVDLGPIASRTSASPSGSSRSRPTSCSVSSLPCARSRRSCTTCRRNDRPSSGARGRLKRFSSSSMCTGSSR